MVTPPHTSAELVAVETRPRRYPPRRQVMREIVKNEITRKYEPADDPGGTGREIVREIRVCPPCKRTLHGALSREGL